MTETRGQGLAEHIMNAEPEAIRGATFRIPPDDAPVPPLYPHQEEALRRLEARDASTILHLPTGSGKTRIALEFVASVLRRAPQTTILWASYPTTLIRQAMVRTAELAPRLPEGLRFAWAWSDRARRNRAELYADHDLIFMLRGTLSQALADVGDRPRESGLRALLATGRPLIVIYDECHQLGARRLQRGWRVLSRKRPEGSRWPRLLGLSATPLPRNPRRRILMRKTLFPKSEGAPDHPDHPWRMDVAYRVQNATLERLGVLCPINVYQQRSGFFDIPTEVLDRATWRRPIEEPTPEGASSDELLSFAAQFNARVMSHPLVLRFLAGRIATRIEQLGKTLVFMPTIRAANALYALLTAHPATAERVFMVHTRLDELTDEGEEPPRVYEELARFAEMGDAPSVMINVEMLTTGFDDPKIGTVVLARLTYSMNLYWQMIGRGSRGPRSGGTADCMVIDPIRLTRLYPIAAGYRPTLTQGNDTSVSGEDVGEGRLDPTLTVVEREGRAGPGPSAEAVEMSWFDAVELDEEALTAWVFEEESEEDDEASEPEVRFDAPASLRLSAGESARERLHLLTMALSEDGLQRVALAFGIPFAGEVLREDAADEILDAVVDDGRAGASAYFDALLSTELRQRVRDLDLPTPTSKKGAFVATLIHDWILDDPRSPLLALVAPDGFTPKIRGQGQSYRALDKRYTKRGLQKLLDRLGEPRSAKNKRILIRRIFETFLARELAEDP